MRVHGGSIILEPGLTRADFDDVHRDGVWLAKAGFGAVETARDYVALVRHAREAGLLTTLHTGGASIPGSFPITGDDLIAIDPTVSFHINGGPVAIEDRYFEKVAAETGIAMQVCTAGNLRTTLLCAEAARKHDAFDRFLIATDTPTGSGVMPLGMIYTMVNIASLAGFDPTWMIAASTGNVAEIYGLNSGFLRPGRDADVVIIDAPLGATKPDALTTMSNGDPVAIGAVITDALRRPQFPASSAAAATPRRRRARSPSPAARCRPSLRDKPGRPSVDLVFWHDPGLLERRVAPFDEGRQAQHGSAVGGAGLVEIDPVGVEPGHHRRVHGVGRTEGAEQEIAACAVAAPAVAPDLADSGDVVCDARPAALPLEVEAAQVHGHVRAKGGEARVHLVGDRPGHGAHVPVLGPETDFGVELVGVFQDREGLPDSALAVLDDGYAPRRRDGGDGLLPVLVEQQEQPFGERDSRVPQGEPGPKRPGRVILVADHEG